jgi:hypothetical protein
MFNKIKEHLSNRRKVQLRHALGKSRFSEQCPNDRSYLKNLGMLVYSADLQKEVPLLKSYKPKTDETELYRFSWYPKIPALLIEQKFPVSLEESSLSFDQGSSYIQELYAFGKQYQIEGLNKMPVENLGVFWLLRQSAFCKAFPDLTQENFFMREYENSLSNYIKYFKQFISTDRPVQAKESISIGQYFASIYANEWRAIAPFLSKPVSIHDCGTNIAILPSLMSHFHQFEVNGQRVEINKIIASDINLDQSKVAQKLLTNASQKPVEVEFRNYDLLKDLDQWEESDLIFLNDVLEHLPNDESSFKALKNIWEKAKVGVLIHVPIEKELSTIWGHYVLFTGNKLRSWARELTKARIISDEVTYAKKNLTDHGYLILLKEN